MDTSNIYDYKQPLQQPCTVNVVTGQTGQSPLWKDDHADEEKVLLQMDFLSLDNSDGWSITMSEEHGDLECADLADFEDDEEDDEISDFESRSEVCYKELSSNSYMRAESDEPQQMDTQ